MKGNNHRDIQSSMTTRYPTCVIPCRFNPLSNKRLHSDQVYNHIIITIFSNACPFQLLFCIQFTDNVYEESGAIDTLFKLNSYNLLRRKNFIILIICAVKIVRVHTIVLF